ncbi:MAG: chloride channel protein [Gammaproteobacteria bacterium]|nr:chloride channel protein [Gammaproteobacteria bacterium]MBU6510264.1 chloride channel protein [Gammaproteobacteria bacterium]MDE1984127.1 chloride channel protein [Gammaproteobacteria bacterium]MDE2108843.1 chloride channel protein [Gammaproteobacteria bacterium]MDE2459947.1 chloride channel protein [Gammaproteobacteria bacterium]
MSQGTPVAARARQFASQFNGARTLLMSMLAALIGLGAGLTAYILFVVIAVITNFTFFRKFSTVLPNITVNTLGIWVLVIPAIAGLIVGLMAKYGSSKIRGHGIPEAMEAILINKSRIAPRVAILKPLSAAIVIGTGGPYGAEGPIIQTGGALGSLVGQMLRMTAAERKVLLACGAGAGMAATFSTPIAGVILAIELLLFEFRARSFIPLVIATTLATTVHIVLIGPGPMFKVGLAHFNMISGLPFYLVLAVLCGYMAVGMSKGLYWVEDLYEKLHIDMMWWPAIGAFGVGVIGFFVPRILGIGYGTITDILNNHLALSMLLLLLVFKSLALLVSLGSGTSGGLLAPMFTAGGALGGAFAIIANHIIPGAHLDPAAFAIVGMAAVFAAASRATFAFIVFAFEITREYQSVLPLMLVCVIASGIAQIYLKESIMTERLSRRGLKIHLEYEVDPLREVSVASVMDRNPPSLSADMLVAELARRIGTHDASVIGHNGYPLLDAQGRLVGIITRTDVFRAIEKHTDQTMSLLQAGSADPVVAYPDESLHTAVNRMLQSGVGRLPVVDRDTPDKLVGYVGRTLILNARARRLEEESETEDGWLSRAAGSSGKSQAG